MFIEKRIAKTHTQNRMFGFYYQRNLVSNRILWITTSRKIFEVNHRYRSKPKISPNSRKCCKWSNDWMYM